MPVYRWVGEYRNTTSGLTWSNSGFFSAAAPANVLTAFNSWNTALMGVCSNVVAADAFKASDVAVYRDEYVTGAGITSPAGLIGGPPLPDAIALLLSGFGGAATQGESRWWLHGVAQSLVTSDYVDLTNAGVIAMRAAASNFLYQYRKVASPVKALPVVNPPAPFAVYTVNPTAYARRLGRPFGINGQQRAYRR